MLDTLDIHSLLSFHACIDKPIKIKGGKRLFSFGSSIVLVKFHKTWLTLKCTPRVFRDTFVIIKIPVEFYITAAFSVRY